VRQWILVGVGAVVLVAVVLTLNFYQMPVVALSPGPAEDVLSRIKVADSTHLYDSKGKLFLTSVGIDDNVRFYQAILDLANPDVQLRPRQELFPKGQSTRQVDQQNANDMEESKQTAMVVALRQVGYRVEPQRVTVAAVLSGAPADGRLQVGDRILRVDRIAVSGIKQVQDAIRRHRVGQTVTFTVHRHDADRTVTVAVGTGGGQPRVGIALHEDFGKLPVSLSIDTEDIGGPSAGLMFTLGIIDKLTPGDLTGGRRIAGTGQIEIDQTVDPIGGIDEKLVAARREGATVFLVPADNCAEAKAHPPGGLRLVKVRTLADALDFLQPKPGDPPPQSC
jgi:PDZ domain-containing protein